MTEMLRIINGRVYDPINGIDGEMRDICIQDIGYSLVASR